MHCLRITFAMEMAIAFFATATIESRSLSRKENEKREQANPALAFCNGFSPALVSFQESSQAVEWTFACSRLYEGSRGRGE